MKTTPLISLAACAGLLLSGCQYYKKNFAVSPVYKQHGPSSATLAPIKGKIHLVWAPGSAILPVTCYVDGVAAGAVPGTKLVSRTKHSVHFYNVQTHSAFPDTGIAIPVDLSPGSNNTEATIEVKATSSPPSRQSPGPGTDNNTYTLAPFVEGSGTTGQISAILKATCNQTVTVNWYRNGIYAGTVPSGVWSTQTGLSRTSHWVHFYNNHDHTTFPIPDLEVQLEPDPGKRDAKVKVCISP